MWRKWLGKLIYKFCLFKGGAYIKLGQILSNQHAAFSKEFIDELKHLQHNVPHNLTEDEYNTIIGYIDHRIKGLELVDTGSVAVVFKGYLDEKPVAIKIVRPNIKSQIEGQRKNITWILSIIDRYNSQLHLELKWVHIYDLLIQQTNMQNEADYLDFFYKTHTYVVIPKPHTEFTTDTLLVMDWIDGVTLSDLDDDKIDKETRKTLGAQYGMFVKESYESGCIHMDLHPGNILITPDNKVCVLDFGFVSKIAPDKSKDLFGIIDAIMNFDCDKFIKNFMIVYIAGATDDQKKIINDEIRIMWAANKHISQSKPYILLKNLHIICEQNNVYVDHECADHELSFLTAKGTFTRLWYMSDKDFYTLVF